MLRLRIRPRIDLLPDDVDNVLFLLLLVVIEDGIDDSADGDDDDATDGDDNATVRPIVLIKLPIRVFCSPLEDTLCADEGVPRC